MTNQQNEMKRALVTVCKWVTCPHCNTMYDFGDQDLPIEHVCTSCGKPYALFEL